MEISVTDQTLVFLFMVLGGMGAGLLYDIFLLSGSAVKGDSVSTGILDFIFWIVMAFSVFGLLYLANNGEVRGYEFFGIALGVVGYKTLLSRWVMQIIIFIVTIILRFFIIIFKIILTPLVFLYKMLINTIQSLCAFLRFIFKPVGRWGAYMSKGMLKRIKYRIKKI